jgi:uncharacterized membrane protein YozB (DUF420 family)
MEIAFVLPAVGFAGLGLLLVGGGYYVRKKQAPPFWLQISWLLFWMVFSLRYFVLPKELASGMFVAIYDPVFSAFPGAMRDDFIPCSEGSNCSAFSEDRFATHVGWAVRLFDSTVQGGWHSVLLRVHIVLNTVCLLLMPVQLYLIKRKQTGKHKVFGRVALLCGCVGTSCSMVIALATHGQVEEYGGVWSVVAFGSMWAGTMVPAGLGYAAIKRGDLVAHKKWMVRLFGTLFGSFFFWRFEALFLAWLFRGPVGWLFFTVSSWFLGGLLFDTSARRSGFYEVNVEKLR